MEKLSKPRIIIGMIFAILFVIASAIALWQASLPAEVSAEVSKLVVVITNIFENTESVEIMGEPYNVEQFTAFIRKFIGHFGLFSSIGLCGGISLSMFFKCKFNALIDLIAGICIASATEIIQLFTPGRCGILADVILDGQGVILSSLIVFSVCYIITKGRDFIGELTCIIACIVSEIAFFIFSDGNKDSANCNTIFIIVSSAIILATAIIMAINLKKGNK